MSDLTHHGEWLSLIDVSGPFLAEPVLKDAFPQGLEGLDPTKKRIVRQAYDEWREALDLDDPDLSKIHLAWIELVLKQVLEFDEKGDGDVLKSEDELPNTMRHTVPEHGISLHPDYAVVDGVSDWHPLMLITVYGPETSLTEPIEGESWIASPAERMVELCRATDVRLGLVTNGERWMFVDAPVGAITTFASWYARLWVSEPITLQAFVNLLGIRRFFVDRTQQLPALLDNSLKFQDEVTEALGEQIQRAVEVLIQALDRADVDRKRDLLNGIEPTELYEAGLTVMMRVVFLLSAEERGLLLLGDERYEAYYAVSTLRMQLRGESEEILERRWDAWSRLLAIFRAVYGGIDHEAMRLPALGGSLFNPDRFPFLEGRSKGSAWRSEPAIPLPIDNRTVLYLLDAVQLFQGRTLSYLALDIEQIGYVYEGLLERTVIRAEEVTIDLDATKSAKNPWVSLAEIDDAVAKGRQEVEKLLIERTASSPGRIRNDLDKAVDDSSADKLLTACHADRSLCYRLKPYFHLMRSDRWGYPLVYPKGAFMVTSGADRRETGTHYTPKSFTEAIVKDTLEPIVYVGPAEGSPREEWKLKSPSEILELKICDPAMGSGAFLVQVCRWLSERLVEAWAHSEDQGKAIASEGEVVDEIGSREPLRNDAEERLLTARRSIAERCLYGVDMNPLAVELAKLSIWLVTLAKGRPFGFLDHNLRCGDSLLGIASLEQLDYLEMAPGKGSAKKLFASKIDQAVARAIELRSELRRCPIRDIQDVETMARLDEEARHQLKIPDLIADVLIGEVLAASGRSIDTAALAIDVGDSLGGDDAKIDKLSRLARKGLSKDLPDKKKARRPFHWPLEFPEVFNNGKAGFDAIVGNPPFLGGKRISGAFGSLYQKYLVNYVTFAKPVSVDLVVHFFVRVHALLKRGGYSGLLGRRSINEGTNRDVGLRQLLDQGMVIYSANTNLEWPGKAAVVVHRIHIANCPWPGDRFLNGVQVENISEELNDKEVWEILKLQRNLGRIFQGTILSGEGFKISDEIAKSLLESDDGYNEVIFPFIGGSEINKDAFCQPMCWVICFWDWPEARASQFREAFSIVEASVKPGKLLGNDKAEEGWWLYLRPRPELYHAIGHGDRFVKHPKGWISDAVATKVQVLVISTGTTKYPAFTFLSSDQIYSNKLCVLADDRFSIFSILSSDVHGIWAWSQKTTLQADMESMRYAHGNIFETFPFPNNILDNGDAELERLGKIFYAARKEYMEQSNKGLTKFYNDFHDPTKDHNALKDVRRLHEEINQAVGRKYEWDDIDLTCGFHEVGYLPTGSNVRFTIDEEVSLAVLRRLSKLNKVRVEEQIQFDASWKDRGASEGTIEEPAFDDGLFAIENDKA